MWSNAAVRLHQRWRYSPLAEAGERLPSLANVLVPGGPAAAVLLATEDDQQRAKLLSDDIARPLQDLSHRGEMSVAEIGLSRQVLRVLELEGVVAISPPTPLDRHWIEAAADEESVSIGVLRWGAAFSDLSADRLTKRLYFFGRFPVTAQWMRKLSDEDSVARWLGLGPLEAKLDGFRPIRRTPETWVWRRWARSSVEATAKLYVCCVPHDLPSTLRACAPVIRDPAVIGFKVGYDLPTILRPDKFMLFLRDGGSADRVAADIVGAIGPAEIHPLPFTATTSVGDFVVSATDPDDWTGRPSWHERASWRLHICRLAAETISTNRDMTWTERVAATLERLSLAGIDTQRWSWRNA